MKLTLNKKEIEIILLALATVMQDEQGAQSEKARKSADELLNKINIIIKKVKKG